MKKTILLLILTVGLTTGFSVQGSALYRVSRDEGGALSEAEISDTEGVAAPTGRSVSSAARPTARPGVKSAGSRPVSIPVRPVAKPIATAAVRPVTLSFVVDRGRIFAADAAGELTALRLSGFFRNVPGRDSVRRAALNEFTCENSLTLKGMAHINIDSAVLGRRITASVDLPAISAPQGLTLTLTVDGEALSVVLPFVSPDRKWRAGYKYVYTITVEGDRLAVSGVTPIKMD